MTKYHAVHRSAFLWPHSVTVATGRYLTPKQIQRRVVILVSIMTCIYQTARVSAGLTCHQSRPFTMASCSRDSTVRLWSLTPLISPLLLNILTDQPWEKIIGNTGKNRILRPRHRKKLLTACPIVYCCWVWDVSCVGGGEENPPSSPPSNPNYLLYHISVMRPLICEPCWLCVFADTAMVPGSLPLLCGKVSRDIKQELDKLTLDIRAKKLRWFSECFLVTTFWMLIYHCWCYVMISVWYLHDVRGHSSDAVCVCTF